MCSTSALDAKDREASDNETPQQTAKKEAAQEGSGSHAQ